MIFVEVALGALFSQVWVDNLALDAAAHDLRVKVAVSGLTLLLRHLLLVEHRCDVIPSLSAENKIMFYVTSPFQLSRGQR